MQRIVVLVVAVVGFSIAAPVGTAAASSTPPGRGSVHVSALEGPTGVCHLFTPSRNVVGGVVLRVGPPTTPTGPGFFERDVEGLLGARLSPSSAYSIFLANITVVDGVPVGCAASPLGTVTTNRHGLLLFRIHAPGTFTDGTLQVIVSAGPAFALTGWATNFVSVPDICASYVENPPLLGISCLPGADRVR